MSSRHCVGAGGRFVPTLPLLRPTLTLAVAATHEWWPPSCPSPNSLLPLQLLANRQRTRVPPPRIQVEASPSANPPSSALWLKPSGPRPVKGLVTSSGSSPAPRLGRNQVRPYVDEGCAAAVVQGPKPPGSAAPLCSPPRPQLKVLEHITTSVHHINILKARHLLKTPLGPRRQGAQWAGRLLQALVLGPRLQIM